MAVYCRAGCTPDSLAELARKQFGVAVEPAFTVVPLQNTHLLQPEHWPRLTLVAQALGSLAVAWHALRQQVPEVRSQKDNRTSNIMRADSICMARNRNCAVHCAELLQSKVGCKRNIVCAPVADVCACAAIASPRAWPLLWHRCQKHNNSVHVQVWIDTVGWPASYPAAWLAGAQVVAYVHYPTISTDMLHRVARRDDAFNNSAAVSSSALKTQAKLLYYRLFALLYGWLGAFPMLVMVNSTWTQGHICAMWWRWRAQRPRIVYPPCDVGELQQLSLKQDRVSQSELALCSVAQFRPEKNHRYAHFVGAAI